MRNIILVTGLMLAFSVHAGNDNSNGGCQGNCPRDGDTALTATGGSASALAGAAAHAAAASNSSSTIGDVKAYGGNGGSILASGNSSNMNSIHVDGDTYQTKRNAPGIISGSVFPTATCKAGFGIGGSGAAGGGLLNIATTDRECQIIVLSQNFSAIGKNATACELLKITKTWARAVKKNPALVENCK